MDWPQDRALPLKGMGGGPQVSLWVEIGGLKREEVMRAGVGQYLG